MKTAVTYDALRRPVTVGDPLGRVTRMSWCNCGGLRDLTDPAGNVTTWTRDVEGRVAVKTLPDGAETRYVYAPVSGRLSQVIDPKGQVTNYEYEPDGNVRRVSFSGAPVPTAPIEFAYDANYARPVSMKDGVGTPSIATTLWENPAPCVWPRSPISFPAAGSITPTTCWVAS